MDPEENTKGESKEVVVGDENDTEDAAFENGRCGICMYVVIDRGVLDCCHHWFCFECIDNWATITNRCPLCKNEFQLITCLPVYDTTGSIKAEEHSLSRDDDWCIQGNNNTLSFPSYYIDEDAVICLDGDGCKIRSGVSTADDALALDTSIACDSCDIWYHAFCVGFTPECTLENSWLCPRCAPVEVKQKSDCLSIRNLSKHSILRSAGHGSTIDPSFWGKVSVSVADAGETAVVVSMVGGELRTEANSPSMNDPDINTGKETRTSLFDPVAGDPNLDVQLDKSGCVELMGKSLVCSDKKGSIPLVQKIENSSEKLLDVSPKMDVIQPDVKLTENSLAYAASEMVVSRAEHDILNTSLDQSQDVMLSSSCDSFIHGGFQAKNTEETTHSPCHFNECNVSCPLSSDSDKNENGPSENKCDTIPHLGISATSPSSVDDMVTSTNEDIVHAIHQKDINSRGLTMKHKEKFQAHLRDMDHLSGIVGKPGDSHVRREDEHPAKRAKLNETSLVTLSASQDNASVSENSQTCSMATAVQEDDYLRCAPYGEALTPDIMDIVREAKHRKHDGEAGIYPATKTIEKRDNSAGLRVKKIMRRVGNKESSILFQELRKEIREIVQIKNSDSTDQENAFDGKLLTAFRDAIVKPSNELSNKLDPSVLGVRKSLLQKGKIRENLTKKIYGTSTGKRRRAWDRDWEVEFWKYRCSRMKPEKTETLQSVLELLKKASNSCLGNLEMDQGPEEATDSILSRVYLADASVFPRKDDIKPLSALAASSPVDNNQNVNNNNRLSGKDYQNTDESAEAKNPKGISKGLPPFKVPSSDNTGRRLNAPSITGEARPKTGSTLIIGRGQDSNEPANHPGSSKNDKRKWALEVLARKNASANSSASEDKQENGAMLKGNYPLLAQLPVDMRPAPAPSRHNKVPVAVRQAQLYRITEHYLRKANLVVIRRTAETELAVADAINVEKDIFERSNSKLVYINLCSQVLSQNTRSQAETSTSHLMGHNGCGLDHLDKGAYEESGATVSSEVEEALRMAGLSDTPPSSPGRVVKEPNEEDPLVNVSEEGLEKVLDIDSHPELDMCRELDYDLGDNGYIAHSSMPNASRVSKLQPENEDSRTKVMLPTLKFEESDKFSDSDALKTLCSIKEKSTNDNLIVEAQSDSFTLLEYPKAHGAENANVDVRLDASLTLEQSPVHKEPSLAEYEELCGPEKEHLVKVISDVAIGEGSNCMGMDAAAKSTIPSQSENNNSKDGVIVSEFDVENCTEDKAHLDLKSSGGGNSPTHSSMDENALKEGKSKSTSNKLPDSVLSISKKVEAFIKEHIRPLCKSGVITVEQYRWAVAKTTDKVMRYHCKAKNANFLIKEGDKVKRLAEQYVEVAQLKEV